MATDPDEYHYAPVAGAILMKRNGERVPVAQGDWEAHHQALARFFEGQQSGDLEMVDTITFGHMLHHGHRGLVQVYKRRTNGN